MPLTEQEIDSLLDKRMSVDPEKLIASLGTSNWKELTKDIFETMFEDLRNSKIKLWLANLRVELFNEYGEQPTNRELRYFCATHLVDHLADEYLVTARESLKSNYSDNLTSFVLFVDLASGVYFLLSRVITPEELGVDRDDLQADIVEQEQEILQERGERKMSPIEQLEAGEQAQSLLWRIDTELKRDPTGFLAIDEWFEVLKQEVLRSDNLLGEPVIVLKGGEIAREAYKLLYNLLQNGDHHAEL